MKKVLLSILSLAAMSATGFAQTVHYSEDFESTTGTALPAAFTQTVAVGAPNDSVGWNSGTNTTLGSSAFSPNAHTRFVAVNDDKKAGANNSNSFMTTGGFTVPSGSTPWLSCDCSFLKKTYSGATEAATVEVSTTGGASWTVVSTLASNSMYWW